MGEAAGRGDREGRDSKEAGDDDQDGRGLGENSDNRCPKGKPT